MKPLLLTVFLFSSAAFAYHEERLVIHPQADVNYFCRWQQSLDECLYAACITAGEHRCRVYAQNDNVYYIETYVPRYYDRRIVVVTERPVIHRTPCIFWLFNFDMFRTNHEEERPRYRQRRNVRHH